MKKSMTCSRQSAGRVHSHTALERAPLLPPRRSENKLDGELDLPLRDRRPGQQTRPPTQRPIGQKDVTVVGDRGRGEVGMIQDVEDLGTKLHVEILRDALDAIVLEDGEVQIRDAWADQDVPAGVASKIETLQVGGSGGQVATLTIICNKKRSVRCRGDGEALGLDIVVRVPRICKSFASGTAKPVRKGPIVIVLRKSRVIASSPCRGERHPVIDRENQTEFPAISDPLRRSGE